MGMQDNPFDAMFAGIEKVTHSIKTLTCNGAAKSKENAVCSLIHERIQLHTYKPKTVALTNSSRREICAVILVAFNT